MRQLVVTGVGGLLALGFLTACKGDSVGEGLESSLDATPQPTPTPEVQTTAPDVPACYPAGAPFPEGEVVSSIGFSDDDMFLCTMTVEVGELAPAIDGYRSDLVADGWILAFDTTGDTRSFGVAKGEHGMFVSGEPAGGASTISIVVVPRALVAVPTTAAAP